MTSACAALLLSLSLSLYDSPSDPKSVVFEACQGARCERLKIPKDKLNNPDLIKHQESWLEFVFCSRSN